MENKIILSEMNEKLLAIKRLERLYEARGENRYDLERIHRVAAMKIKNKTSKQI
jgi:hypothetical protein